MGTDKNIKQHIVTDIKIKLRPLNLSTSREVTE